ncbi:hypothetical protein WJX84_012140 [Apatococcus fuscideae]|uniref:Uncharacterized protein n=1 Tax=Apatococcus fuscideae TaxID=2026836 RepID=A0AAW1T3H4_9CHLO
MSHHTQKTPGSTSRFLSRCNRRRFGESSDSGSSGLRTRRTRTSAVHVQHFSPLNSQEASLCQPPLRLIYSQ